MPGVEIRVPMFGGTRSVANLTIEDNPTRSIPYMNQMIAYFVSRGYVKGETIRAAPYDWRLSVGMCMHDVS